MTKDPSEPHSIWLCPSQETTGVLSQMIDQIAAAQDAPSFAPHLTVLGDLEGPIEATIAQCRSGFSGAAPVQAKVGQLSRSDAFFMALYLNIFLPDAIADMRASMAAILSPGMPQTFTPHVSLAYGALPIDFNDLPCQTLTQELDKEGVIFNQVAIVRSAKTIPIERWTIAAKFDLAG